MKDDLDEKFSRSARINFGAAEAMDALETIAKARRLTNAEMVAVLAKLLSNVADSVLKKGR